MLRLSLASLLVASLLTSVALPAFAQSAGEAKAPSPSAPSPAAPSPSVSPYAPPAPPPAPAETVWYGWQTLASDAAAAGLLVGGLHSAPVAVGGLALYAAGAPAVHLGNGEIGGAGRSLLLRLGLPAAGALIFYGATGLFGSHTCSVDCEDPERVAFSILIGGGAGMLGAIAIDAIFATKQVALSPTGLRVSPSFAVTQGGAVLGAFGSF